MATREVRTHGSILYTFSEILSAHFDGNKFSTATRNIYQEWLNIYNSNPPDAKAVNVYLDDHELN